MDLTKLLKVVETAAIAFVPGAASSLAAGRAVVELVQSVRPTLAEDDQAKLDQALPPLLSKMNRDVDQAIEDLGGTGR